MSKNDLYFILLRAISATKLFYLKKINYLNDHSTKIADIMITTNTPVDIQDNRSTVDCHKVNCASGPQQINICWGPLALNSFEGFNLPNPAPVEWHNPSYTPHQNG